VAVFKVEFEKIVSHRCRISAVNSFSRLT